MTATKLPEMHGLHAGESASSARSALRAARWYRTIRTHPRAIALARELDLGTAWRFVLELWAWAETHRRSASLAGMSALDIARAAGWTRDAVRFHTALRIHGFLDASNELVAWEAPTPEAERKRRWRRAQRGTGHGTSVDTSIESKSTPSKLGGHHRQAASRKTLRERCTICRLPLMLAPGEAAELCARCVESELPTTIVLSPIALAQRVLAVVRRAGKPIRLIDLAAKVPGQPPEAVMRALDALLGGQRLRKIGRDVYELGPRADAAKGKT